VVAPKGWRGRVQERAEQSEIECVCQQLNGCLRRMNFLAHELLKTKRVGSRGRAAAKGFSIMTLVRSSGRAATTVFKWGV